MTRNSVFEGKNEILSHHYYSFALRVFIPCAAEQEVSARMPVAFGAGGGRANDFRQYLRDQGCQHCIEQDRRKSSQNNFCVASPVIDITYDTLKELQQAVGPHDPELGNRENPSRPAHDYAVTNGSYHEGQLVRLAAFVHLAKYSNTSKKKDGTGGENVNCDRPGKPPNDLHIVLVPAQNKVETESVTAEASPHFRPAEWTDDDLNHFRDHLFRFTGQLFLDTSHTACGPGSPKGCTPKRISVWEVHPVYAIEICESTDASTCQPKATNGWVSLEEFLATDNEP